MVPLRCWIGVSLVLLPSTVWAGNPPNIVLMVMDNLGRNRRYGGGILRVAHKPKRLDALAAEGARITQFQRRNPSVH